MKKSKNSSCGKEKASFKESNCYLHDGSDRSGVTAYSVLGLCRIAFSAEGGVSMKKQSTWIQRLLSVPLMILFILTVYSLNVPNPMIILIIPIVYFTYSDGYISGALSGATSMAYAFYFFLIKTRDPVGGYKVATIILAMASIIFLVGKLKAQDQRNIADLEQHEDALLRMATTDKLTGALNRHAFFERANTIYENSHRQGTSISLLFIDIDYFKQINDQYGHIFGDAVLSRLSGTLENCLRNSDVNCRYGGEEFLLLLADADGDAAQLVASRVMEQVRMIRFEEYPDFRFTVSIGVSSTIPTDPPVIELLIRSADNAMYQAKQEGRNQIAVERLEAGKEDAKPFAHPCFTASSSNGNVGASVADITEIEEERQAFKNLLESEQVIRECMDMLYQAKTLEEAMENALRRAGEYSGADRAYFFSLSGDALVLTNQWCMPQFPPGSRVQKVNLSDFYQLWSLFGNKECIVIESMEQIQPFDMELYQAFHKQEIKSAIFIPLEQNGRLLGIWGVENPSPEKAQSIAPLLLSLRYSLMSTMRRVGYETLLEKLSFEDSLTGLCNRNRYLRDISAFKDVSNTGAVYISMNEMKRLNDTFGHAYGDQILAGYAEKIKRTFSSGISYRMSGDEFVVICRDIPQERFEQQVRTFKMHYAVSQNCHAAIGYHWEEQGEDIRSLIHEAEAWMYEDKKRYYRKSLPGDRYRYYNDNVFHLTEPGILKKSLEEGHFLIYLQPKVSFANRILSGAEALIRYRQEDGTVIPPVQFLPVLEDAKLISLLDFFVFDRTCAMLAQWINQGRNVVPISVNFSRYTLAEQDFLLRLQQVFDRYCIEKKWIVLEVTESVKSVEGMNLLSLIDSIRAAGFFISIDDFGVDFANLSLFSLANFDELKLDKVLVDSIATNQKAQLVIESIVAICRKMNIGVVAEGVETEEQFHLLRQNGCNQAQGYLFSKPIPVVEYEEKYIPVPVGLSKNGARDT
ncbi:diguanylate cyclase [Aminipila luticellarii]|uniref:diguanylate cyclase n=1 Tax=Aminipila luticellarii TaxID=2507160 RepID=UPI0013E89C39|nr:diguanylate cyclase [Aminipila luticellarii]